MAYADLEAQVQNLVDTNSSLVNTVTALRDSIAGTGNSYPDTAAGLESGKPYFTVPFANDGLILYERKTDDAGVAYAEELLKFPTEAKVNDALAELDAIFANVGKAGAVTYVDSIADMLAIDTAALVDGQQVSVQGYHAGSDVGGGVLYWDAASAEADNGGTVFAVAGVTTGRWKRAHNSTVDVLMFGAVGDGVADDTDVLRAAITSGAETLFFPEGDYAITELMGLVVSNLRLFGPGRIVASQSGIHLQGNYVDVDGLTFSRPTKSTSTTVQYTTPGLRVEGDHCTISSVRAYNMDGPGISIAGRSITVDQCYAHDNIMGLLVEASCRDTTITSSRFTYNNVNEASGADGILCSRSVTGLIIEGCDLSYNGEHGLYFQGQKAIIRGNRAVGNAANGLKFGSYDDGLYTYAGEVLDKWVDGTGYGMRGIVISDNYIEGNHGLSGIYFQPSSKDVLVTNNVLRDNNIRWVYFNYTGTAERLEDHLDIQIVGNRLYGTNADISIAGHSGLVVKDNKVDGQISIYAPNGTTAPRLVEKSIDTEVSANTASKLVLSRASSPLVAQNTVDDLLVHENTAEVRIRGNTVSALSASLDTARIAELNDNTITVVGNIAFNSSAIAFSFPKDFSRNTITGNSYTTSYFINASYNADIPLQGRFLNNYIECTSCARPLLVEGAWSAVSNNIILGSSMSDITIDVHGDNLAITGNVCRYAGIHLRNDTASVVTGNKCSGVSGAGTTNIVANNG